MAKRLNSKLCRRYFGPFQVVAQLSPVAYKLALPPTSRIHPVFHVSLLKPHHGIPPTKCYPLPELSVANRPLMTPLAILATRIHHTNQQAVKQVLVQWSMSSPEDTTWEDFAVFCKIYQLHNLEDKVHFEEGSNVSKNMLAQVTGPIQLNQEVIQKRAQEWMSKIEETKEETGAAGEAESYEQEDEQELSHNRGVVKREERVRKKPGWLKDFVTGVRS